MWLRLGKACLKIIKKLFAVLKSRIFDIQPHPTQPVLETAVLPQLLCFNSNY